MALGSAGDYKYPAFGKGFFVQNPGNAENGPAFFTPVAITINKMAAVLVGSATPSVTWTIRYGSDRSATNTEVVTGGTTTTSTTTGSIVTSFNSAAIPAGSWVIFKTTAQSGTVNSIEVTILYDLT